jgi:chromosome segregation ATPase
MNETTSWRTERDGERNKVKDLLMEIEDLKKSEHRLLANGKKQEEQYNSVVEQLKRIQADCRDAYTREQNAKLDLDRMQVDLKKAREHSALLDAQLRDSKSFEDNLNRQLSLVRGSLNSLTKIT